MQLERIGIKNGFTKKNVDEFGCKCEQKGFIKYKEREIEFLYKFKLENLNSILEKIESNKEYYF